MRGSLRQRIAVTAVLFGVVFAALGARAVQLTIWQGEQLAQRATRQQQQAVPMMAQRGTITDRNGDPLALSRESAAVYLRPREWSAGPEMLRTVRHLLALPQATVVRQASAQAPFVWLQRQVPLDRGGGHDNNEIIR